MGKDRTSESLELDLYPAKLYRGTPPHQPVDTSIRAARDILPSNRTLRAQVFRYICDAGGATDEEIGDALDLGGNTVRPRRRELVLLGEIRDSGKRRATRSGRKAIVWVPR